MALRVLASVLTGLGLVLGAAQPAQGQDTPEVADYLRDRMDATDVPGLAYAVVSPERIHATGAWGTDGDGEPVDVTTPFLWGSVAKPVTASAVMTLVEDGRVDLDERVRTYLPSFRLADAEVSARITVRHLLEQTSGIPEGTGVTDRFDRRDDPYDAPVADLADVSPLFDPGTRHEYASANYLVLGAIVEAVTGMPYAQYLRVSVLDPLDMDGAITTPDEAKALPAGHRYLFGQPVAFDTPYDPTGPSYGYLGGTVTDLAHFAMAHLAGGRYADASVLDAESVTLMHTGAARISDTHRYGLGWRDDERNADLGTSTIWHAGASPGYQAMIALLPEKDRAIVVLQNAYGFFADAELAATGLGAARIVADGEPDVPAGGATYPIILAALSVLVVALVVTAIWPLKRILRPATARPRSRRRIALGTVAWLIGSAVLAYVAGIALPRSLDTDLGQIPLFAPDVGWLLIAVVVLAIATGIVRLAGGVLTLNGARRRSATRHGELPSQI